MIPERPIRLPVPARTLARIDRVVASGRGGYDSRSAFIQEAIEQLLDLSDEETPRESARHAGRATPAVHPLVDLEVAEPPPIAESVRQRGALVAPARGYVSDWAAPDIDIDQTPLFGLHNRDYPSLWATRELCEMTQDEPVPFDFFLRTATHRAWTFAEGLAQHEVGGRHKLTALFPTNHTKPQSATEGFRNFAIGVVQRRRDRSRRATGPLFAWNLCALIEAEKETLAAPTSHAYDLLGELDGIDAQIPHSQAHATAFLRALEKTARPDATALSKVVTTMVNTPTRARLLASLDGFMEWTGSVLDTNVQGYIGRAREWGLLELGMSDGRYELTDFGRDWIASDDRLVEPGV